MLDYSQGKIYKLFFGEDCYVGSTTQSLNMRMYQHKHDAYNKKSKGYDSKVYKKMREKGGYLFKIELLEDYPCENKRELEIREQEWINKLKPNMNTIKAGREFEIGSPEYYQTTIKSFPSRTAKFWCANCNDKERTLRNIARHRQTPKHINAIDSIYSDVIFYD